MNAITVNELEFPYGNNNFYLRNYCANEEPDLEYKDNKLKVT